MEQLVDLQRGLLPQFLDAQVQQFLKGTFA
jgi:hypothetical protein